MWKVVPISDNQKLDVRPEDLLNDGLYRKCNTYRGGGGYDQFPVIAARRFGIPPSASPFNLQFIVQLFACTLDCPYCYVTRAGVWGKYVEKTDAELIDAFLQSGQRVFHLMGGAPGIYLKQWAQLAFLLGQFDQKAIFHSDLLLNEGVYSVDALRNLANNSDRHLIAIDVKGTTDEEWLRNTRRPAIWDLFWENFRRVQNSGIKAYVTFTGVDPKTLPAFWERAEKEGLNATQWRNDSFVIDLIEYDAVPYVDSQPWGKVREPT